MHCLASRKRIGISITLAGGIAVMPLAGCKSLPGTPGEQGAVGGGLGGAAIGAGVAGEGNRLIGALIGAAAGAGGGYLIGANKDKILGNDSKDAQQANQQAKRQPATASDVRNANTADLNNDGFVTMDEVVAMQNAGLSDPRMLDRLGRTGQVFDLTPEQKDFLANHGVSNHVINQMGRINEGIRRNIVRQKRRQQQQSPREGQQVISQPPPQ